MSRMVAIREVDMQKHLMLSIGISIGILLAGGLISFGISCTFLLSRDQDTDAPKQHRLLRMYILILLVLVSGYILGEFIQGNEFVVLHSSLEETGTATRLLAFITNIIPVFGGAMTDGLLVWRCYMMHKTVVLQSESRARWHKILWIFPACLWNLTIGTGCAAASVILVAIDKNSLFNLGNALQTTALLSNAALNIYATLFIAIRLINSRRIMLSLPGSNVDTPCYLDIVNILLESAAINVPLTIAAAIGIGLDDFFGSIIAPVAVVGQAFASVIIIHQVVVNRAIHRRQGEELSKLIAERRPRQGQAMETRNASLDV